MKRQKKWAFFFWISTVILYIVVTEYNLNRYAQKKAPFFFLGAGFLLCCTQGMTEQPVDGVPRYLAPSVALFEVVDDDLLPIRALGIQVCVLCVSVCDVFF